MVRLLIILPVQILKNLRRMVLVSAESKEVRRIIGKSLIFLGDLSGIRDAGRMQC